MPTLSKITANFFLGVINRLGVRPPPPESFELSNVVQPVALVDSDIAISAAQILQLGPLINSAGQVTNPAASAVLADTGALAVGNYSIIILYGQEQSSAASSIVVQHRDAANATSIWSQMFSVGTRQLAPIGLRDSFAAGERLRVIMGPNGSGATDVYQVSLFWVPS